MDTEETPEATEAIALEQSSPWIDDLPAPPRPDESPWLTPEPRQPTRAGVRGYDFERDAQGFTHSGPPIVAVERAPAPRGASGSGALAVRVNGAGTAMVRVMAPPVPRGAVVRMRVYVPRAAHLAWIQPFVQQDERGGWKWTGSWQDGAGLPLDTWSTFTVQVPADASSLSALGLQLATAGSFSGTIYLDDVTY